MNDLLEQLYPEQGEPFRSRVASDVLSGGNVVDSLRAREISGRVTEVSRLAISLDTAL